MRVLLTYLLLAVRTLVFEFDPCRDAVSMEAVTGMTISKLHIRELSIGPTIIRIERQTS